MTEDVAAPQASTRVSYLLVRAAIEIRRRVAEVVAEHDVTPIAHATLQWAESSGPVSQKALAAAVGIDTGDMTKLLDQLRARGLVTKDRDDEDRRRFLVSVTDAGSELLDRIRPAMDALEEDLAHRLDGVDLAQLASGLSDIMEG